MIGRPHRLGRPDRVARLRLGPRAALPRQYPRSIFDFVLGLNRWVLRVGAYAALMTPEYPPFRLDRGENEPGGLKHRSNDPDTSRPGEARPLPPSQSELGSGRVIAVVVASLAVLAGLAALAGGAHRARVRPDPARRQWLPDDGLHPLLDHDLRARLRQLPHRRRRRRFRRTRHARHRPRPHARARSRCSSASRRAAAVDSYLADVRREVATRFDAQQSDFRLHQGGAPATPPTAKTFWAAQVVGTGTQTLSWTPQNGDWRIVVMNASGSAGIRTDLALGARFPHLLSIGIGALGGAALLLLLGGGCTYAAVRRRG